MNLAANPKTSPSSEPKAVDARPASDLKVSPIILSRCVLLLSAVTCWAISFILYTGFEKLILCPLALLFFLALQNRYVSLVVGAPLLRSLWFGICLAEWVYLYGGVGITTTASLALLCTDKAFRKEIRGEFELKYVVSFLGILSSVIAAILSAYWLETPLPDLASSSHFFLLWSAVVLQLTGTQRTFSVDSLFWLSSLLVLLTLQIAHQEYIYYFRDSQQIGHPIFLHTLVMIYLTLAVTCLSKHLVPLRRSGLWKTIPILFATSVVTLSFSKFGVPAFELQVIDIVWNKGVLHLLFGFPSVLDRSGPPEALNTYGLLYLLASSGVLGTILTTVFIGLCSLTRALKIAVYSALFLSPFAVAVALVLLMTKQAESAPLEIWKRQSWSRALCVATLVSLGIAGSAVLFSLKASNDVRYPQGNTPVDIQKVPQHLLQHLLAKEDLLFVHHHGVDLARLKWVLRDAVSKGDFSRGASTLTMQLAKMKYLTYEKTVARKFSQILLSLMIEASSSKQEILQDYLARIAFGQGLVGIEDASRYYFGKEALKLTPREGLLLVLTIENPVAFTPHTLPIPQEVLSRGRALQRRRLAFRAMLEADLAKILSKEHL